MESGVLARIQGPGEPSESPKSSSVDSDVIDAEIDSFLTQQNQPQKANTAQPIAPILEDDALGDDELESMLSHFSFARVPQPTPQKQKQKEEEKKVSTPATSITTAISPWESATEKLDEQLAFLKSLRGGEGERTFTIPKRRIFVENGIIEGLEEADVASIQRPQTAQVISGISQEINARIASHLPVNLQQNQEKTQKQQQQQKQVNTNTAEELPQLPAAAQALISAEIALKIKRVEERRELAQRAIEAEKMKASLELQRTEENEKQRNERLKEIESEENDAEQRFEQMVVSHRRELDEATEREHSKKMIEEERKRRDEEEKKRREVQRKREEERVKAENLRKAQEIALIEERRLAKLKEKEEEDKLKLQVQRRKLEEEERLKREEEERLRLAEEAKRLLEEAKKAEEKRLALISEQEENERQRRKKLQEEEERKNQIEAEKEKQRQIQEIERQKQNEKEEQERKKASNVPNLPIVNDNKPQQQQQQKQNDTERQSEKEEQERNQTSNVPNLPIVNDNKPQPQQQQQQILIRPQSVRKSVGSTSISAPNSSRPRSSSGSGKGQVAICNSWNAFLESIGLSSLASKFAKIRSTPLDVSSYDNDDLRDLLRGKVGIDDVEDRNTIRVALQRLLKERPQSSKPNTKEPPPKPKTQEMIENELKAIIKIQAFWRGYSVRSKIQKARKQATLEIESQLSQAPDDYLLDEVLDMSWVDAPTTDINSLYPLPPSLESQYMNSFIPPPPDTSMPLFTLGIDGFHFVDPSNKQQLAQNQSQTQDQSDAPMPEHPGNLPVPTPLTITISPSSRQQTGFDNEEVDYDDEEKPDAPSQKEKGVGGGGDNDDDDEWHFSDPHTAENMRRMYNRYETAQTQRKLQQKRATARPSSSRSTTSTDSLPRIDISSKSNSTTLNNSRRSAPIIPRQAFLEQQATTQLQSQKSLPTIMPKGRGRAPPPSVNITLPAPSTTTTNTNSTSSAFSRISTQTQSQHKTRKK